METIELKSYLYELIDDIEDYNVLNAIYLLLAKLQLKTEDSDFWDDLPEHVKAGIEEGLAQAERGEGIPHNEVMKKIKAKYPQI
jgi:hypothetical protein